MPHGGDPEMGDSDVQTTGIDGKYSASITSYLSTYVRGGLPPPAPMPITG